MSGLSYKVNQQDFKITEAELSSLYTELTAKNLSALQVLVQTALIHANANANGKLKLILQKLETALVADKENRVVDLTTLKPESQKALNTLLTLHAQLKSSVDFVSQAQAAKQASAPSAFHRSSSAPQLLQLETAFKAPTR